MTTDSLFPGEARLSPLAEGVATWAEGPVWVPAQRALRFSDIPADRILQWNAGDGSCVEYATGVGFTNGRTTDLTGAVVQCSHGRRRVEVDRDGTVTELVAQWRGHRFNSPNDVVVRSDGTVWFTDPSYGIKRPDEGHAGDLEYGDHWVFRHDPSTGETDPVVTDVMMPNGLAFSPDESVLYVSDTSLDMPDRRPRPDGGHGIRAYDVREGRWCKDGRLLTAVDPGIPDGFRVDERGNVWTSAGDGVQVFTPAGELVARLATPKKVGNLCFGGDTGTTLFVLATDTLWSVETSVRDASHVLRGRR